MTFDNAPNVTPNEILAAALCQEVRDLAGLHDRHRAKHIAFGWYGGKYSHLDWLLPHLPAGAHHFCDVFGGSAAVLLNRDPAPVETYNDIDSDLVTFFRVLREHPQDLINALTLTPFSRQELADACSPDASLSDLERARRFYVRARQVRTGLAQTASPGRWACSKDTSRRGMAGGVSRWNGGLQDLAAIAERLKAVQIENRNALDLIAQYDTLNTLFYCDPPYPHQSRSDSKAYGFEMTDTDHRNLAAALNNIKGRAVVSSYHCNLTDEIFDGWHVIDAPPKRCHSSKTIRQEALWLNFKPEAQPGPERNDRTTSDR